MHSTYFIKDAVVVAWICSGWFDARPLVCFLNLPQGREPSQADGHDGPRTLTDGSACRDHGPNMEFSAIRRAASAQVAMLFANSACIQPSTQGQKPVAPDPDSIALGSHVYICFPNLIPPLRRPGQGDGETAQRVRVLSGVRFEQSPGDTTAVREVVYSPPLSRPRSRAGVMNMQWICQWPERGHLRRSVRRRRR